MEEHSKWGRAANVSRLRPSNETISSTEIIPCFVLGGKNVLLNVPLQVLLKRSAELIAPVIIDFTPHAES